MKKKNWTEERWLILTTAVLSAIVVVLFYYVYLMPESETNQYSVEVIEINTDCQDCFDVKLLADQLTGGNNLNVKSTQSIDYNSKEAQEIINKYNLKAVPALVVLSGDIEEIGLDEQAFSIGKNYASFDKGVPYIDLDTNQIKGIVELKEIQSDTCIECAPLFKIKSQFEEWGVKVGDYEVIGASSDRGKDLIRENDLKFTSSLLISKDIEEYWWIFNQIQNSLIEKENYYLFKNPVPPYVDLEEGKIKGKVDITYIQNKSCEDCFNVTPLKGSFQSLGVYIENERYVDVSSNEGKNLLNKYNIRAIPTVILSEEISDYNSLTNSLEQIGTFESDGSYVLRKLESLNAKYQKINE